MTETAKTHESTNAVAPPPEVNQPPARAGGALRRWTFGAILGAILVQTLVLAIVAALAFRAGYFSHERENLTAMRQMMENRLAAQERIGELEKEVLQLRIAQLEDQNRRATVVEVDLGDVLTHLRDRIVDTASAHKAALAADASTMLTGVFSALVERGTAPAVPDTSVETAPAPDAHAPDVAAPAPAGDAAGVPGDGLSGSTPTAEEAPVAETDEPGADADAPGADAEAPVAEAEEPVAEVDGRNVEPDPGAAWAVPAGSPAVPAGMPQP